MTDPTLVMGTPVLSPAISELHRRAYRRRAYVWRTNTTVKGALFAAFAAAVEAGEHNVRNGRLVDEVGQTASVSPPDAGGKSVLPAALASNPSSGRHGTHRT
jgi:hypothetical protein